MERSIDAARQKRLHDVDGPVEPRPLAVDQHAVGDGEIPRRKARPKRATPQLLQRGGSEYRAEAI